jgi:hypothetical protein
MPDILDEGGGLLLDEGGGGILDEAGVIQAGGSWWGLDTILKQSRSEFDAEVSRPPLACPVCGEPLTNAPAMTSRSGAERFCKFAGDHEFIYPRDFHPPSRPLPG